MASLGKTLGIHFLRLAMVFLSLTVLAEEDPIAEDTLKAVYSFKFAMFADWPDSKLSNNATTLGFCIVGKNPFGRSALEAIEGKQVKEKSLRIEFFESGLLPDDALNDCHILFVSQSETIRLRNILKSLRHRPILTISDIEGFSSQSGMITLIKSDDRIQFEINLSAIKRAGLSLSSKIIELATLVKDSEFKSDQ